jgi:hypothetical protein
MIGVKMDPRKLKTILGAKVPTKAFYPLKL